MLKRIVIALTLFGFVVAWTGVAVAQLGQPPSNVPPLPNGPPAANTPPKPNPFPMIHRPLQPPSLTVPGTSNNPHSTLPWGDGRLFVPQAGTLIRYWTVPDSTYTVEMAVAQPGSLPPVIQTRVVTLPGYVVAETTRGYLYPGRWTLTQAGFGGPSQLQWLPPAFYPK
jgi:hypothetical protein